MSEMEWRTMGNGFAVALYTMAMYVFHLHHLHSRWVAISHFTSCPQPFDHFIRISHSPLCTVTGVRSQLESGVK